MRPIRTIAAVAAVAVLAAGCAGDDDSGGSSLAFPNMQLASSLQRFESCDEVRAWAHDELAPRVGAYGLPGGEYGILDGGIAIAEDAEGLPAPTSAPMVPDDAAGAAEGADRSAAPAEPGTTGPGEESGQASTSGQEGSATTPVHSDTNVQEEGVDEPDIVKTDGDRILALAQGKLHLVSAADARVLDSVDLPEAFYAGEMLASGDRVLVVANATYAIPELDGPTARPDIVPPQLPTTRVVQVDVQDDQLSVSETFELDGNYVSARMTDDVVRLVLHADPEYRLPFVTPANPGDEAAARAEEMNQQVVDEATAEDFMPRWRRIGSGDETVDEGVLVQCDQAHAPQTFSGFGMVAVVSVDLSEGLSSGITAANGAGVMAGGQTVYASPTHLYVAAPEWVDWQALPDAEARTVAEDYGTDIHRFDISDPNAATYEMSGHVDGTVLNQFALDEQDDNLRVATTTGTPWIEGEGESESHVVVLAPEGGGLTQVGGVSGLGRGESIQSVRFLGDVGYVVTFEQTDPLYTIDLSDPTDPRVAGELEMLGYSAYLHPIGDGRLIGVGQDATETGSQLGTQVSLFDVRDPAAPTRVAQTALPNASSGAEWDHRAFLWWPETGLVAIPVSSYDGNQPFEGLVGYQVDVDGAAITEVGRVQHPNQVQPGPVPLPVEPGAGAGTSASPPPEDGGFAPTYEYPTPILRSLVIGGQLWTVSDAGLAVSDLATLGSTNFVPFTS